MPNDLSTYHAGDRAHSEEEASTFVPVYDSPIVRYPDRLVLLRLDTPRFMGELRKIVPSEYLFHNELERRTIIADPAELRQRALDFAVSVAGDHDFPWRSVNGLAQGRYVDMSEYFFLRRHHLGAVANAVSPNPDTRAHPTHNWLSSRRGRRHPGAQGGAHER